eukprot:scaffold10659_cov96-Isochrysis_galbana.AAC.7
MSSRPVLWRRKRYSGSSSGAGDGAAHEDLTPTRLWRLLYEPGAWQRARRPRRRESTEMDMVPGPEVVRTLSFVDQEALLGAARVGNPTVASGSVGPKPGSMGPIGQREFPLGSPKMDTDGPVPTPLPSS